jgi:hypothetical protein
LDETLDEIRRNDDGTRALFVRAIEKFLSAAEYSDQALMRSHFEEAKASLGDSLADSVEALVKSSSTPLGKIKEFMDLSEGEPVEPDEQFDELGHSLSRVVSAALRHLGAYRDGPLAMARRRGIEVPNAAKLDEHIAQWQGVKANLVDCWPWTDAPLPPADRVMIAASRAALRTGEQGESLEAVIERRRSK